MVKKEEAIVLILALSQLGTGMCVDGRAMQGEAMNKLWKNSWSDRETSIAVNRSPRGCGSFMLQHSLTIVRKGFPRKET